ncbi:MAG: hypothetical protein AB7N24_21855 [Dehalococcoidia bacterium]
MAEPNHADKDAVFRVLNLEREVPLLSLANAAEVDNYMQKRAGPQGNLSLLSDLANGRFEVPCLELADFRMIEALNDRYRDLGVGLSDLSTVVIAFKFKTTRLLTFDQRHFRLIRPLQGGAFTLLPFDEDIEP